MSSRSTFQIELDEVLVHMIYAKSLSVMPAPIIYYLVPSTLQIRFALLEWLKRINLEVVIMSLVTCLG